MSYSIELKSIYSKTVTRIASQYELIIAIQHMEIIINNTILNLDHDRGDKILIKTIEDYLTGLKILEETGKKFSEYTFEMVYTNFYQLFEDFISECFKIIYTFFPKFLLNRQKEKYLTINFYDLFEIDDSLIMREKVIDLKINDIMFSKNIIEILRCFNTIFSLDIEFSEDALEKIFVISKNRNLIIHNNGIVNARYIDELKRIGIATLLEKGFLISKELKKVEVAKDTRTILFDLINQIFNTLETKEQQLKCYHDNL